MQMVILAGGKATRLHPVTKTIPKSMVKIHGKPFLGYQLELLKKNKITDIVLCLGMFSQQIIDYFGDGKDYGASIKYSIEEPDNLLGTAGALKKAENLLNDIFLVMYGDSYLPIDFMRVSKAFQKSKKDSLMTVYKNNNRFDKSNVITDGKTVLSYDKSGKNQSLSHIDYGLLVFKKSVLDIISLNEFKNLDYLITELIDRKQMAAYEVNQRFYEIGTPAGITDFENYIKN